MLGADKRVLDGCEIPRVTLGYDEYDEIREIKVEVGCKIPGVNLGYDKFRQVKMKNAAIKLIMLDSENDDDIVDESTGVDMHARHEMVLPMDQQVDGLRIKSKVADLGKHGKGLIKLNAGEA